MATVEQLRDPDDEVLLRSWMSKLGRACGCLASAEQDAARLEKTLLVTTCGELAAEYKEDVEKCVQPGTMAMLLKYLWSTPQASFKKRPAVDGAAGCVKDIADDGQADTTKENGKQQMKKFPSQQGLKSLGEMLGDQLQHVKLPPYLFYHVNYSKNIPLPAKGRNSAETVCKITYKWAFCKWGNLHEDAMFCEHVGGLIDEQFPAGTEPWGQARIVRPFSKLIKNIWRNVRQNKVCVAC